jgi:hypothetical protein
LILGFILPHDFLEAHEEIMWFVMVVVLNPYLFILGLGFGYFRAAWQYKYGPMRAPTEEEASQTYYKWQGLRHGNNPADPSDPYWHQHPANPMSVHQRHRRMERMFGKR